MNFSISNGKAIILILLLTLLYTGVSAQTLSSKGSSGSIIEKVDSYNGKMPAERLYLHWDKPYYAIGDTMWFKGYLTNLQLAYSPLSSRVYVDLINDSNKIVKRFIFPVSLGLTVGNIYLDEKMVHEGTYTIRAYTNWMRNFDAGHFFYTNFYVAGPGSNSRLIQASSTLSLNQLKVGLKFTPLKQQPQNARDLQVMLVNDKKEIFRRDVQVSADGILSLTAGLPDHTRLKNLELVMRDKKDNATANMPVKVLRIADVDVQFMPESGPLVASLPAHIGFKAIGEDGRGVAIKGTITDKENNTEVSFETIHNGMGVVDFVPQPGESYTAQLTLPTGETKTVSLPAVKSSGTLLRVKNKPESDTLEVAVLATKDIPGAHEYTLLGQTRGVVCYAAVLKLTRDFVNIHIPKSLFPTGVASLTLFNAQEQPVNERMIFIDHHDNLKIDVNTGASSYAPRDSVPLKITVKDDKGNPVVGSFSLAVTDDRQIKPAIIKETNIFTQLLLSADLQGYIEDPAYYFMAGHSDATKALDALLLTQGWVDYSWKAILEQPGLPAYAAEPEYLIRGQVNGLLNKPLSHSNVTLLSTGKVRLYKDTVTDGDGKFILKKLPLITDSTVFVLQARKASGRIVNAGITVEQPGLLPATGLPDYPALVPWYINSDSTMLNYVKTTSAYHDELTDRKYGPGSHLLKAVDIRDKTIIKGSQNLNGAGNYDQAIAQEEIEKEGKISLLELIKNKVNGFHEGHMHKDVDLNFMLKEKRVRFVIDGIDVDRFYEPSGNVPNEHYNYQRETLDYLSAEDITGIEVIYSMKYNALYNQRNLTNDELLAVNRSGPAGSDVAYLEITTRSGNGPFTKKANGIFVYKPAAVTMPAAFYRPRYLVKNGSPGFEDLRSTIHWEPNIITNKKGEASTSFYAADTPTTYTITLQGANLDGKVGYTTQKLIISK